MSKKNQKITNRPAPTSKKPVHWWSWGDAALKAAQKNSKPILLFITHWTSPKNLTIEDQFKQAAITTQMNETFICIKLNRDDRPDIATLYQAVLPQLGQKTSWPLLLFLTPEAKPYWGHSPLQTEPTQTHPSVHQALTFAEKCYKEDNEAVKHNAATLTELIAPQKPKITGPAISDDMLRNLAQRLGDMIDTKNGGLRGTPKFPQFPLFHCLWRLGQHLALKSAKHQVEHFLTSLFQGGICDQTNGGIFPAAKDERWQKPLHFEKTLYDNALMLELASLVYKETKSSLLKQRCEEIIEWANRDMRIENSTFTALSQPNNKNDKLLTDWNAMMIGGLTTASSTFKRPEWLKQAQAIFQTLDDTMMQEHKQLHCKQPNGHTTPALANDYAQMIKASLTLHTTTNNDHYLQQAQKWTTQLNENFWCHEVGGYFTSSKTRTDVILRGKTGKDEAIPNANGIMSSNLMQLYKKTGDATYQKQAKTIIGAFGPTMAKNIFSHLTLFSAAIDTLNIDRSNQDQNKETNP